MVSAYVQLPFLMHALLVLEQDFDSLHVFFVDGMQESIFGFHLQQG